MKDIKVQFCTKDKMCIGASEYSLPVICNDFPLNFNVEEYFKVRFSVIIMRYIKSKFD